MTQTSHRWRFFRSGGFDQVRLDSVADLQALSTLDQKLWAALACPVSGLQFDARTLAYIDTDKDGRIRAPELIAAVQWALSVLGDASILFADTDLPLNALSDSAEGQPLKAAAKRLLMNVGRSDAAHISLNDTADWAKIFPADKPNGDGLVPEALAKTEEQRALIRDVIDAVGSDTDRSGEPALSEERITQFFEQIDEISAWRAQGHAITNDILGDETEAALTMLLAVNDKINDYFHRVQMAAFDPRAAALMNGEESALVQLAAGNLADVSAASALPLANISADASLPLNAGLNPAWASQVQAFAEHVVKPLLGNKKTLSASDWQALKAKTEAGLAWLAARPENAVADWPLEKVAALAEPSVRESLLALVAEDKAVAKEAEGLLDVDKLLCYQKHLVTLLNNFISMRDFYTRRDKAIFQAGTLFIDGKSCDLTIRVNDVAKHSGMASASGSYLVYCDCTRIGSAEKMSIVAAVTAGDSGKLIVGRNGVFYDRQGRDWDAQVVKLIEHPISVREAFWTPYRRISKMLSEQMQKMAAARDKEVADKSASGVAASTQHVEKAAATPAAKPGTAAPPAPFDIAKFAGIFAAVGLAVGAIGTALAAIATGFLSLKLWQMPLALIGAMLFISGPSMLLAWFKLRKRNLAPLLDANGWAVNTEARINIPFGTSLTQLATLPAGAERALTDPYAQKSHTGLWIGAIVSIAAGIAFAWWQGWLVF